VLLSDDQIGCKTSPALLDEIRSRFLLLGTRSFTELVKFSCRQTVRFWCSTTIWTKNYCSCGVGKSWVSENM